ncbi:MAG: glycosyl transferase [Bdellovibrio sp.]|nr:MAG: glycosyl transferase [Bdellovibrio sp.]
MTHFPIFLSVVVVARNQAKTITSVLHEIAGQIASTVADYELVLIDNGSHDESHALYRELTGEQGIANLQVYALTKEVDFDTASWAGLESSLGDFMVVFDPTTDNISFLPRMLEKAVGGSDVVFAYNKLKPKQSLAYRIAYSSFDKLFKSFVGVYLSREAPCYRVLSKRVVNFILQHPQPALTYRHLPATGGFARSTLEYSSPPKTIRIKNVREGIDKGMRLLVSTTQIPMRLVTSLSLFGAIANLLYSLYVVLIAIIKKDVAPGWTSLSLQQSGMFFLISLVLMVLGEYIIHMASLSTEGPLYHIAQEFTSARMTRRQRLNVEFNSSRAEALE